MCGISGFIKFERKLNSKELKKYSLDMSKVLFNRGRMPRDIGCVKKII